MHSGFPRLLPCLPGIAEKAALSYLSPLLYSHSGKTIRLIDIINNAKNNNIPIISFVADKESTIFKESTLPISIGYYDSFSYELNKMNTFFGETIIAFEHLLFDE